MKEDRADIYQRITDQIVEAIEKGAERFQMPWHKSGSYAFSPINAQSKRPYRGINVVVLWAAAQKHGYSSGTWATYKQWQDLGRTREARGEGNVCCLLEVLRCSNRERFGRKRQAHSVRERILGF